jgi:putative flippase GtrA
MSRPVAPDDKTGALGGWRHWLAFVAGGSLAFGVDAGVLLAATKGLGLDPFSGRLLSVACGMLMSWLFHRNVTFPVAQPPSLAELARFVSVAATSAAINYGVYAAILLLWPAIAPLAAMVVSSLVAMVSAYLGMRFGVFRRG